MPDSTQSNPFFLITRRVERAVGYGAYLLLMALPLLQIILRPIGVGILGLDDYLSHALLIIGFIGGMIAASEGRHLAIGSAQMFSPQLQVVAARIWKFLATILLTTLTWSALALVIIGFDASQRIGNIPILVVVPIMIIGYAIIGWRFIRDIGKGRGYWFLGALLLGTIFGFSAIVNLLFFILPEVPPFIDTLLFVHVRLFEIFKFPLIILFIASAFLGMPLFVVLGGVALVLFASSGGQISIVSNEGYNMLTNRAIPAIPLFTLAGYLLSESNASRRLIRLFRQLLGWLPGGLVITAVVGSAFFTSFTGASGVTILALGGLLLPMLLQEGKYKESFSVGLLTSSSNIGLLFPPSLAIILYGTIAQINIFHMFVAGLLPGILVIIAFSVVGVVISWRKKKEYRFSLQETWVALKDSIFELLLPVVVLVALFTGTATLVESAAIAVLYAFIIEVFIKREISFTQIKVVLGKCLAIIGGVLMILASARGLSFYIIDAQIPDLLSEWVSTYISSEVVFLLILNLCLLITGCFMDIFSAILIVAPLVIPLGELFGIHPVHLGIIFLANLGVGFITPPVGIDLFLSSYRFGKPLTRIYRYVAPFFLLQIIMVLIITYIPSFSTFLLRFVENGGG